jgi:general secretion pathway protein G
MNRILTLAAAREQSLTRRGPLTGRAGMTLIEILIVIAILGSLMALVAVNVAGSFEEANVGTTELQIKKIEEGLGMYAAKHKGKYPSTSDGLEAAAKYMGVKGEVPMDSWGNAFQYFSPGTNGDHKYEIVSLGGDGKEGGDDTDADIKSWELN